MMEDLANRETESTMPEWDPNAFAHSATKHSCKYIAFIIINGLLLDLK